LGQGEREICSQAIDASNEYFKAMITADLTSDGSPTASVRKITHGRKQQCATESKRTKKKEVKE
jgi:hypothetical protein